MLLITKHSRFHRAVVSAAALMTVAGGIAEALPISAEAQTFSYPQPTAPPTAPAYPYQLHQQQPMAQGTTDQLNREELGRLRGWHIVVGTGGSSKSGLPNGIAAAREPLAPVC